MNWFGNNRIYEYEQRTFATLDDNAERLRQQEEQIKELLQENATLKEDLRHRKRNSLALVFMSLLVVFCTGLGINFLSDSLIDNDTIAIVLFGIGVIVEILSFILVK